MKKLLLTGLLAALAVPATMSAMDKSLTLTFNVTGTSVSNGVTVNVEGVSGVTATLNSVKVGDQELGLQRINGHADYLCNGSVNGNTTTEASPLTYNFTIEGIPSGYSVDNLQLITAACTASAGVQDASDSRLFNTTVLVDDSELVSFGEIDIKKGNSAGLKTWFEELTTPASLSGTVNLTVSAYMPSGSLGCFFGLQSLTFNYREPLKELDQVALNFNISNKNDATANTVTVDSELEGVTAKIVSLTNNGNNLGLLDKTTPANILIPNANGNTSPNINLQIEVEGLPEAEINNVALNIWAYNNGGTTQVGNINSTDPREWNIAVAINEDTYATIDGLEIVAKVTDSNQIWTGEGETAAVSTDPLILDITLSALKDTNVGSFFGIESITFNYTAPVLVPEYDINDVIGTYSGTYEDYDYNSFDIKDVIVAKGNSENSLVITNLFPSLPGMSVNATFDPFNNTIIIPEQWIGSTDYYFAPYDDNDYVDKAILTVIDDKLTSPDDVALYVFEDGTYDDIEEMFSLNLTKEAGSTDEPDLGPAPALDELIGNYAGFYYTAPARVNRTNVTGVNITEGTDNTLLLSGLSSASALTFVTTYNQETGEITLTKRNLGADYYVYFYQLNDAGSRVSGNLSELTGQVTADKKIIFKNTEIAYCYWTNGNWSAWSYVYDLNLEYQGEIGVGMTFESDGILYSITSAAENNRTVTTLASEYSNTGANNNVAGEVVIPETVSFNGYDFAVTAIGKYSFSQSKITNLTIPASVTKINYAAFFNCADLQYVTDLATKPQSISTYDYVFYGSSYNTAVLFVPEESVAAYKAATEWKDFGKIIEIGGDPDRVDAGDNFEYDGIVYTVIDPQAYTVKTKEGTYFSDGYWEGQNVSSSSLEIPDEVYFQGDAYTVVEIGNGSFAYSASGEGIQSISIPDSVTTIGEGAFSENYNVTSISLGSGLEYVGADAFYSLDSLEEVSITAVVPPVADEDAFYSTTVSRVTLTVPALSLEVYETAQVWKDFNIVGDDGSTGINSLESIDGNEVIYNLNGVRVSKDRLTKGIYIINGKKVLVK